MNVLTDPLPDAGLLCVEASAGTGKTHLLSTLAVRWVVERDDVHIADLLVVTYTVAAAAELRARIRDAARRGPRPAVRCGGQERRRATSRRSRALPTPRARSQRAERALAEFDTASISTIHGFAAAWLGDERGGVGPSEERRRQAVADVLSSAAFDPSTALFEAKSLSDADFDRVVRLALDNPDLGLTPRDGATADPGAIGAPRRRSTGRRAVRGAGSTRRGAHLRRPPDGPRRRHRRGRRAGPARAAARASASGLIDEFQDTDPAAVGDLRAALPRRRRTAPSSSSATRSRRSTASAAPTSRPTSRRSPPQPTRGTTGSASTSSTATSVPTASCSRR